MIPTLSAKCSEFLWESDQYPLIKYLPTTGSGFRKVKLRKKAWRAEYVHSINNLFPHYRDIMHRSMLASTAPAPIPEYEAYYVFPPDGYKYFYNPMVENTLKHYEELYTTISNLSDINCGNIFEDMVINYSYTDDLVQGIRENAEIVIYNISHYYALRKSLVDDYRHLIYDDGDVIIE